MPFELRPLKTIPQEHRPTISLGLRILKRDNREYTRARKAAENQLQETGHVSFSAKARLMASIENRSSTLDLLARMYSRIDSIRKGTPVETISPSVLFRHVPAHPSKENIANHHLTNFQAVQVRGIETSAHRQWRRNLDAMLARMFTK